MELIAIYYRVSTDNQENNGISQPTGTGQSRRVLRNEKKVGKVNC
ncbi:hypothetical protein ES703_125961 [subsurface metagenome]